MGWALTHKYFMYGKLENTDWSSALDALIPAERPMLPGHSATLTDAVAAERSPLPVEPPVPGRAAQASPPRGILVCLVQHRGDDLLDPHRRLPTLTLLLLCG